jgi:hypothetical protein
MTEEQAGSAVHDLGDLSAGDVIEAWHEGRRYNQPRKGAPDSSVHGDGLDLGRRQRNQDAH